MADIGLVYSDKRTLVTSTSVLRIESLRKTMLEIERVRGRERLEVA